MPTKETVNLDLALPDVYANEVARRFVGLDEARGTTQESYRQASGIYADDRQTDTRPEWFRVNWDLQSVSPRAILLRCIDVDPPTFGMLVATASHWDTPEVNSTMTFIREEPQPVDLNWERWHELLDKGAIAPLRGVEAAEFEKMPCIVDELDASSARVGARSMDRLVERHERVLASIQELIDAVNAAADSDLPQ